MINNSNNSFNLQKYKEARAAKAQHDKKVYKTAEAKRDEEDMDYLQNWWTRQLLQDKLLQPMIFGVGNDD